MKSRKAANDRQLTLDFQPRKSVEHMLVMPSEAAHEAANDIEFIEVVKKPLASVKHFGLGDLAEQIRAEDRMRLLEPTSLPKVLRGWSPRPRPQTVIISRAAQSAYERRICGGEIVRRFLANRESRVRRLADRLRKL